MALRIGLEQIGAEIILLGAKDFAGVVRSTEKDIDRLNSSVKGLEKESNAAFTSIEQVSVASLGAASIAIGLFVSAIGAISGASIKAAGDYDNALQIVQGVTLGTDTELKALDNTITNLSSHTRVNMKSAADAAGELARAGTDIKDQVSGALEAVLNLSIASAGELGLERAAVLTGSALKAFNLTGEDATRVVNAITVAAQNSAITFVDLQRSFQQAAPAASLFGLTVEDLSATLGVLGEQGIRGSDAGTALKQAFQQLVKPSKQGLDAMREFGISLFDAAGAARPFRDVIIDLEHAFGNEAIATGRLTEAQRAHALAVIFGSDAVRAGIVLSQRGVSAFDEFTSAMNDTTRSAESMAKIMQQSLNNQLQILVNNINILAVKFGTAFVPVLKEATANAILFARSLIPIATLVSQGISDALGGLAVTTDFQAQLNNLVSPEAAAAINGFIALLRTVKSTVEDIVLPSLINLKDSFDTIFGKAFDAAFITQAFQQINTAIVAIGVVIATVADQFATLFSSITDASLFRDILFAIAAVPIIAVAIGIGSITVSIISAIGPALLLATAISGIVLAVSQLDVVKNALGDIGKSAADIPLNIDAAAGDIQAALEAPFDAAASHDSDVLDAIDASVIAANMSSIGPDIENALVEPFNTAALKIADILDAIQFPDTAVIPVGDLLPDSEVTNVISNIDDIKTSAKGLDLVFATIKDQAGQFITDLATTMEKENPRIGAFFSDFGTSAHKLVTGTGEIFSIIGASIRQIVDTLDTGLAIIMSSMLETSLVLLDSMKGISSGLDAVIEGAKSFLVGWATLWNTVTTIAVNAANAVVGIINGIGSALNGLANAQGQGDIFAGVPAVQIPKAIAQIPALVSNAGAAFDALGTRARAALDSITKKNDELVLRLQGTGRTGDELRAKIAKLSEGADTAAGSFGDLGNKAGGAGKKIKEEALPAIDGFLDALTQAIRKQSFIDAFGEIGADAVSALIEAVVNNTDKEGAKAAEALFKFKQFLQKNNVANFKALGEEADEAFAQALIDRSDVAIQAAVDVIQKASDAVKAGGQLTLENLKAAFGLGFIANDLGNQGAKLLDDLKKSIVAGTTDLIRAVGNTAADFVVSFSKNLDPDIARGFTARFMDAIIAVVKDKSPEAVTAFQDAIRQINFDSEIAKAQSTFDKAITDATRTFTESVDDITLKTKDALKKSDFEFQFKQFADAAKQTTKDLIENELSVLKSQQEHRKQNRKEDQEDNKQKLDDQRTLDDQLLSRAEDMASAELARRKRLDQQHTANTASTTFAIQGTPVFGTKDESAAFQTALLAAGVAADKTAQLVDNFRKAHAAAQGTQDEVKALQEKFAQQDIHDAIARARKDQDRLDARAKERSDLLFSEDLAQEFENQKRIIEQPLKDQEKADKLLEHQTSIQNIKDQETEQLARAQRTFDDATNKAQLAFDKTKTNLDLQRELADTVMDGFLADQLTAIDNFTTMTSQFAGFDGTITFTSNSRQFQNTSNDQPAGTGIRSTPDTVPTYQKGGFVPGHGAQVIRAHGGEFIMSVEQVAMFEKMFRPSVGAGDTTIRHNNYNVSASYQQVQSPSDIAEDLKALIALTS